MLPSLSESRRLTVIMTKRTTQTFIGLQWVSYFLFIFLFSQVFYTVLHPRHKLHYFKKAGWEEAWIETSRDIVRAEFDQTYAFMDVDVEAPHSDVPQPLVSVFLSSDSRY